LNGYDANGIATIELLLRRTLQLNKYY